MHVADLYCFDIDDCAIKRQVTKLEISYPKLFDSLLTKVFFTLTWCIFMWLLFNNNNNPNPVRCPAMHQSLKALYKWWLLLIIMYYFLAQLLLFNQFHLNCKALRQQYVRIYSFLYNFAMLIGTLLLMYQ